jgi:murein DD-endopeptidase MepM/ murein hydrolase activator NlpD
MGVSGGSVAPHVHYEVLQQGKAINPNKFIIAGLSSQEYDELLVKSNNQNQSLD